MFSLVKVQPIQSAHDTSMGQGSDNPSTTVDQVRDHVWEAADKTSKALEEGIQAASYVVKSGSVKAREEYAKAMESSLVSRIFLWIISLSHLFTPDVSPGSIMSMVRRASSTRAFLITNNWRSNSSIGCEVWPTTCFSKAALQQYMQSMLVLLGVLIQSVSCNEYAGGVHIAAEHQTATVTALTGLALLILPGPLLAACFDLHTSPTYP